MPLGRLLIIAGLSLAAIGVLVTIAGRLPIRLGHLPGDFTFGGRNVRIFIPLGTCLLLSVVLTLILWLLRR